MVWMPWRDGATAIEPLSGHQESVFKLGGAHSAAIERCYAATAKAKAKSKPKPPKHLPAETLEEQNQPVDGPPSSPDEQGLHEEPQN